jgi:hypothetical protein
MSVRPWEAAARGALSTLHDAWVAGGGDDNNHVGGSAQVGRCRLTPDCLRVDPTLTALGPIA